jgi:hypothetical protein
MNLRVESVSSSVKLAIIWINKCLEFYILLVNSKKNKCTKNLYLVKVAFDKIKDVQTMYIDNISRSNEYVHIQCRKSVSSSVKLAIIWINKCLEFYILLVNSKN